jgi:hypothetical protein
MRAGSAGAERGRVPRVEGLLTDGVVEALQHLDLPQER